MDDGSQPRIDPITFAGIQIERQIQHFFLTCKTCSLSQLCSLGNKWLVSVTEHNLMLIPIKVWIKLVIRLGLFGA